MTEDGLRWLEEYADYKDRTDPGHVHVQLIRNVVAEVRRLKAPPDGGRDEAVIANARAVIDRMTREGAYESKKKAWAGIMQELIEMINARDRIMADLLTDSGGRLQGAAEERRQVINLLDKEISHVRGDIDGWSAREYFMAKMEIMTKVRNLISERPPLPPPMRLEVLEEKYRKAVEGLRLASRVTDGTLAASETLKELGEE